MYKIIILGLLLSPFSIFFKNVANKKATSYYESLKLPGEAVYKKYCISCHQADGGGVPHMAPPLIQTKYVLGDKVALAKIVVNGLKNIDIKDETYNNPMPPLGSVLKDKEIADVLTYVRNSFGNKAPAVTVADVKKARADKKVAMNQ